MGRWRCMQGDAGHCGPSQDQPDEQSRDPAARLQKEHCPHVA